MTLETDRPTASLQSYDDAQYASIRARHAAYHGGLAAMIDRTTGGPCIPARDALVSVCRGGPTQDCGRADWHASHVSVTRIPNAARNLPLSPFR